MAYRLYILYAEVRKTNLINEIDASKYFSDLYNDGVNPKDGHGEELPSGSKKIYLAHIKDPQQIISDLTRAGFFIQASRIEREINFGKKLKC